MTLRNDYAKARSWGEALRRRRKLKNYSQEVVRIRSGISRTILSGYERNGILPNIISAYKILKVLDWTLDEWARDAEEIEEDGSWYNARFDEKYGYSNVQKLTGGEHDKTRTTL